MYHRILTTALFGPLWAAEGQTAEKISGQCALIVELRDGSRVRGAPDIDEMAFQASFGKTKIPLKLIETVTLDADRETGQVVLREGDRIRGAVDRRPLGLATVFGKLTVPIPHIKRLTVVPAEAPAELILWNRLDGSPSVVGPPVEFLKVEQYVPGKAGQAARLAGNHVWGFRVPSEMLKDLNEGTVEFWVKVVRKPPTVSHGSGPIYDFFDGPAHLQYNANDGCSHGKFSLNTSGHFVYTEFFAGTKSTDLLGEPGEWNHYAIVWNNDGIQGTDHVKLALYINGKSHGKYTPSSRRTYLFLPNREGRWLTFHRNRNGFAGAMVYDELKIWNRALSDEQRRELAAMPPDGTKKKATFAVDLREGSHLLGRIAIPALKLDTEGLGEVDVPFDQVAGITFGKEAAPAKVVFRRGDVLVGTVKAADLPIKTLLGKITIPVNQLATVKRVAADAEGK